MLIRSCARFSALLLGAVLCLFATAAPAAIVADFSQDYTISQVIANGGLQVGDKLFGNFQVTTNKTVNAVAPGASDISVRAVVVDGEYGLRFNGGWVALSNQIADTTIKFSVTADAPWMIESNMLKMTAFGAAGGGVVSISENVYLQDPDVTTTDSVANKFVYYVNDTTKRLIDVQSFSPSATIWVTKDVVVTGGTQVGGIAHLSEFYQSFGQVPEPATMAMLALGGIALLRRRRSQA